MNQKTDKSIFLGMGCFWGAQKYLSYLKGVYQTSVGYLNGGFEKVTYEEVCASSGHVEVVKIDYNSQELTLLEIFTAFIHVIDPFSLNQQGNDKGIQYRIGIYSENANDLEELKIILQNWEKQNKSSQIEIELAQDFTLAEKYHQNFLVKNPQGHCPINLQAMPSKLKKE